MTKMTQKQEEDGMSGRIRIHSGLFYGAGSLILLGLISCAGCGDPDTGPEPSVVTDMHRDFDHEHKHQHDGTNDHEHEHADKVDGAHSHAHNHSHRHAKPLYDGRLLSIGHTHHTEGATHFHAEIMPLKDNTICFHLLTESADGVLEDYPIEANEVSAIVSIKGRESFSGEYAFTPVDDKRPASEFCLTIPEAISDGDIYAVVVPKIQIGGQRQNFSFRVSRSPSQQESATSGSEDSHD